MHFTELLLSRVVTTQAQATFHFGKTNILIGSFWLHDVGLRAMKKTLLFKYLGNDSIRWLQTLVALLMIVGVFSVMWELIALHTQHASFIAFDEFEPNVSSDDLLHLNYLQTGCRVESNTVFPWSYAAPGNSADHPIPHAQSSTSILHQGDPRLVTKLLQCPDVDIYLPASARRLAGCAAVAGPLKFLQSRLLPDWVFDVELYDIVSRRKTRYFELCPDTPMLFLAPEHVLAMSNHPLWPANKPVYLMAPGLELKSAATPQDHFTKSVLERTDVVLCRTKRCDQDLTKFLQEEKAKKTRVIYTGQVTADPFNFARRMLGDEAVHEKNVTDFDSPRFAHTTWNISLKSTQDVTNCWSSHANELPPLDVYVMKEYHQGKPTEDERLYFPGDGTIQTQNALKFAMRFSNSSFFICPTAQDDCLNLARASGGVIVTANSYPTNELVEASEGILFPTESSPDVPENSLLLAPPPAQYRSSDLRASILKALTSTSPSSRFSLGKQVRTHYDDDAKFFMLRMLELRAFARQQQLQSQNELQNLRGPK